MKINTLAPPLLSFWRYDDFDYYFQYLASLPYLGFISVILIIWFLLKKRKKSYHSRCSTLIQDFYYSTSDFYTLLDNELQNHEVEDIRSAETSLYEGGIGTHRRLYLKVKWQHLTYFVCAAPFGDHYFFSWHLMDNQSILSMLISKIPLIGGWLYRVLFPVTLYKIDTASMFMKYAHGSVLKVIEEITRESGARSLTEDEKKPVMADIFKR